MNESQPLDNGNSMGNPRPNLGASHSIQRSDKRARRSIQINSLPVSLCLFPHALAVLHLPSCPASYATASGMDPLTAQERHSHLPPPQQAPGESDGQYDQSWQFLDGSIHPAIRELELTLPPCPQHLFTQAQNLDQAATALQDRSQADFSPTT